MIAMKTILYPTDFSDNAKQAVPYVVEMARRFEADLHILHVLETSIQPADLSWSVSPPDMEEKLRTSAEKRLEGMADELPFDREKMTLAVSRGHPSLEIIRYAKEHELDMIVMSTHGHSGLSHFLLGSVTERVVRKSPCPVLTVKSKQLTEYDEADD